jgi:glycosyltransferase involved in cell wall biosynthesis
MSESLPRVMWLLNHTSARKFELGMLKKLGFTEIFQPKSFPQNIAFRSGSVDWSEDASLTIPAADLAVLNATNWYEDPGRDAWRIANQYFDLLFFILHRPSLVPSLARNFRGAAVLRAYGRERQGTYRYVINWFNQGIRTVDSMGRRFSFGIAYEGLWENESPFFQSRQVYLPIGLSDCQVRDQWTGSDSRIFFVCPDVVGIQYYAGIYKEFKENLGSLPYAVGGAQALATNDPRILGFLPDEEHQRNMREFRVMFYHSTEANHVHYHPFEAVRAGMPLVFMGGGLLDKLGGSELPGRCRNYDDARSKLKKILAGDRTLIERIRSSQPVLLEKMRPEVLEPAWRQGMARVLSDLEIARTPRPVNGRRPRIAVVLPVAYRGGTLRSAKLLAQAIWSGSRKFGEAADLVFAYPIDSWAGIDRDTERWDVDLPEFVSGRNIGLEVLDAESAQRAMRYAGHSDWVATSNQYLVPDDAMQSLCDCDLWIVISDRLSMPLLPIRPYVMTIYDFVQRYDAPTSRNDDISFVAAARAAERVLVTTRFTEQDALAYAGLSREKVFRVPMLVPKFPPLSGPPRIAPNPYFLWTTNLGLHKNHYNAFCTLREYYEEQDGRFDCYVCGVGTESLLTGEHAHLERLKAFVTGGTALSQRLRILGELSDMEYRRTLAGASFLWHPANVDNGTFAVVEAASMGVPSLSSRYGAMEEMNENFKLHLTWMESPSPVDMAKRLKWMEVHWKAAQAGLPDREELAHEGGDGNDAAYWSVIRECL